MTRGRENPACSITETGKRADSVRMLPSHHSSASPPGPEAAGKSEAEEVWRNRGFFLRREPQQLLQRRRSGHPWKTALLGWNSATAGRRRCSRTCDRRSRERQDRLRRKWPSM